MKTIPIIHSSPKERQQIADALGGDQNQSGIGDWYGGISPTQHDTDSSFLSDFRRLPSAEKFDIQVIILEWQLQSGESSKQTLYEVRNELPSMSFIVLARRDERKVDLNEIIEAGAVDCLTWPGTELSELVYKVRHIIDRKNAARILPDLDNPTPLGTRGLPDGIKRLPHDNAQVAILINDLTELAERIRENNSLFGEVLRDQLIAALRRVLASLEGQAVPLEATADDASLIYSVGKRVADEASSKGLGGLFKKVGEGLFDLLVKMGGS